VKLEKRKKILENMRACIDGWNIASLVVLMAGLFIKNWELLKHGALALFEGFLLGYVVNAIGWDLERKLRG